MTGENSRNMAFMTFVFATVGLTVVFAGGRASAISVSELRERAEAAVRQPPVIRTTDLAAYSTNRLTYALNNGLAKSRGGRIWASWIAGGDGAESFTVGSWSDDDGLTWSDVNLVIDGHADWHKPSPQDRTNIIGTYWSDPDGNLRLYTDQTVGHNDGRAGVWEAVCRNPDATVPTWEAPRRICDGRLMNKPIVVRNGEWLATAYNPGEANNVFPESNNHIWVLSSCDRGKSWQVRATFKYGHDWQETQLLEMKDGSLRLFIRDYLGGRGALCVAESVDLGRTWTAPHRIDGLDNTNARFQIQRLKSGNLLLVKHGKPAEGDKGRVRLTAYVSADDGVSWEGGLLLDEGCGSYPDAFQSPDGYIYVSHDVGRGTRAEIRLHRFTEEDIRVRKIVSARGKLGLLVSRAMASDYNKRRAKPQN